MQPPEMAAMAATALRMAAAEAGGFWVPAFPVQAGTVDCSAVVVAPADLGLSPTTPLVGRAEILAVAGVPMQGQVERGVLEQVAARQETAQGQRPAAPVALAAAAAAAERGVGPVVPAALGLAPAGPATRAVAAGAAQRWVAPSSCKPAAV